MKLIEADKVKRAMKDYWKAQVDKALTLIDGNEANKRINSYLEHNHELLKAIDELPSIQPERKKGTWTDDASCPFCGFQPWYERDIHTLSFCPNCGADNRGETE